MSFRQSEKKHFFIRVGNGVNFKNSNYPIWGLKSNKGSTKTYIKKHMTKGDILWFITSTSATKKPSIAIGMAEYNEIFDINDERLIKLNTYSNEEMGWTIETNWDIQISYQNLYCGKTIEKHNFNTNLKCAASILSLETFSDRISVDFKNEYNLLIKYAEPTKYIKYSSAPSVAPKPEPSTDTDAIKNIFGVKRKIDFIILDNNIIIKV